MSSQNDFLRNKLDAFANNFDRVQADFERCKNEYKNKSIIYAEEIKVKDDTINQKDEIIKNLQNEISQIKIDTDMIQNSDKFYNKKTFDDLVSKYEQLLEDNAQLNGYDDKIQAENKELKLKISKQESSLQY